MNHQYRTGKYAVISAMALSASMLAACTTTEEAPLTQEQEGVACGFLGKVCSSLTPGGPDQTALRYVNPAASWTSYQKIMIDPVTFWGSESSKISGTDQQMLVDYFHQQLVAELNKKFEIVDKPGPGVIKLDVAILDADTATPGLRSVSMLVPQAHMLSNLKYLATGTFPFVGSAQAAAKLTDSQTGQVLSAAVDRQIGGGAVTTAFQWQWGDAENAITEWSRKLADRLGSWTAGQTVP